MSSIKQERVSLPRVMTMNLVFSDTNQGIMYRMFVPMGPGPDGAPMGPIFPMGSPKPGPSAPETQAELQPLPQKSPTTKRESTTPLDLTKSPSGMATNVIFYSLYFLVSKISTIDLPEDFIGEGALLRLFHELL